MEGPKVTEEGLVNQEAAELLQQVSLAPDKKEEAEAAEHQHPQAQEEASDKKVEAKS